MRDRVVQAGGGRRSRRRRRPRLTEWALAALIVCGSAAGSRAQEAAGSVFAADAPKGSEDGDPREIPEPVRASIRMAQEWLKNQQLADGSWPGSSGDAALAILALMVDGSGPGTGAYGREVALGTRYLLSCQRPSGLFYKPHMKSPPMYCHGFAVLCLSEVWGMSADSSIRDALKKAVRLTARTQSSTGGWRYNPVPGDADLSVTVTQIVALRGALNAGIAVPENTIRKAVEYVRGSFVADPGGFSYTLGGAEANITRAGAGMLSLQMCGEYDCREVKQATIYINASGRELEGDGHYFYGMYYVTQAMYQARDSKAWNEWYERACKSLMSRQDKTLGGFGEVHNTGFAVLALGVPYRYLPIYQR